MLPNPEINTAPEWKSKETVSATRHVWHDGINQAPQLNYIANRGDQIRARISARRTESGRSANAHQMGPIQGVRPSMASRLAPAGNNSDPGPDSRPAVARPHDDLQAQTWPACFQPSAVARIDARSARCLAGLSLSAPAQTFDRAVTRAAPGHFGGTGASKRPNQSRSLAVAGRRDPFDAVVRPHSTQLHACTA